MSKDNIIIFPPNSEGAGNDIEAASGMISSAVDILLREGATTSHILRILNCLHLFTLLTHERVIGDLLEEMSEKIRKGNENG